MGDLPLIEVEEIRGVRGYGESEMRRAGGGGGSLPDEGGGGGGSEGFAGVG